MLLTLAPGLLLITFGTVIIFRAASLLSRYYMLPSFPHDHAAAAAAANRDIRWIS